MVCSNSTLIFYKHPSYTTIVIDLCAWLTCVVRDSSNKREEKAWQGQKQCQGKLFERKSERGKFVEIYCIVYKNFIQEVTEEGNSKER